MDRYAVVGNPVKHSLSPKIHTLFAEQLDDSISYVALEAPIGEFSAFAAALHSEGYSGLNVTVPFKEQAWQLAQDRSEKAVTARAVNTLIRTDSGWRGDNTDGVGLYRDLTSNLGLSLRGLNILILGAGGAVRGVLQPLLEAEPARIHIANRTASKAAELAEDFKRCGKVTGGGLDVVTAHPFDLIINGTAASLQGEVPAIPDDLLSAGGVCYDMMYAAKPTAFVKWGNDHGAGISHDGLGMLVEQAAEAYFLWRGKRPDTAPVLRELRARGSATTETRS